MVAAGPLVIITMRSRQQHGFVDVVRDHHHRAAGARHDLQQLVLQLCAGQRVQRAEGLVHQQHSSGSMASARAMPTRCFMPPEISRGRLALGVARPTSSQRGAACAP